MPKRTTRKSFKKTAPRRFASAETLLEVILALFVVALGAGTATSLIVSSLQANTFNRDNLVAQNLAVEGMEVMGIIRDTNWIKFGYDKSNCWNVQPGLAGGADCTLPANKIAEGYYTIDLNPSNYSWGLTQVGVAANQSLDLDINSNPNGSYKLGYVDIGADGGKDLFVTNATIPAIVTPTIANSGESSFYRMIQITYDTGNPATAKRIFAISTVQWRQNGVHTVRLSETLTNYEKVPL